MIQIPCFNPPTPPNLGLQLRLKFELQNYAVKTFQAFDPWLYSVHFLTWNCWQHSAEEKHAFPPQKNMVNNGEKEEGEEENKGREMRNGTRFKEQRQENELLTYQVYSFVPFHLLF